MSDFETEMNFDNVLNRLKELNPDINISEKIPKFKQDIDQERYIEIWNNVFSQFNSKEGVNREDYEELPSKNIDT